MFCLNLGDKKYPLSEMHRPTGQMDLNLDIALAEKKYEIRAMSSDAVNSKETVKIFSKAVESVVL